MSKHCRDCKFWSKPDLTEFPYRMRFGDRTDLGACSRLLNGYHSETWPEDLSKEILIETDESWGAVMGPDFGCTLWETKTEEEETTDG